MTRAELVDVMAMDALNRRGFAYYTDPMEGGLDAYEISCEARDKATAALAAIEAAGFVCVPRVLVESLCEDVEAAAHGEYGSPPHPALMHKFNRDMGDVREVRRLLAASPLAQETHNAD